MDSIICLSLFKKKQPKITEREKMEAGGKGMFAGMRN